MVAIITSNYYSNPTADFALLSNLFNKLKPNKLVSTDEGINLLRNRAKTVTTPKNKLGESVKNLFKRKEKVTTKPYSLRSSALDDTTQRKIISTVNKQIKNDTNLAPRVVAFKPKQNQLNKKTYSTLSEARKANVREAREQIKATKRAREIVQNFNTSQNKGAVGNVTKGLNQNTKNQNKGYLGKYDPTNRVVVRKPQKQEWGFLTEDLKPKKKVKPSYPFLTENWGI